MRQRSKLQILTVLHLTIFLFFQNCSFVDSKSQSASANTQGADQGANNVGPIAKLSESPVDRLVFSSSLEHNQFTIQFQKKLAYVLVNQTVKWFCPPETEWQNLHFLIQNAQVCATKVETPDQEGSALESSTDSLMCTAIYREPYAKFLGPEKFELPLGEQTSGCQHGPDLCGDKRAALMQWITTVVEEWRKWPCAE